MQASVLDEFCLQVDWLSTAYRAEAASGGNTDQARRVRTRRGGGGTPEGAGPLREERHVVVHSVIRIVEKEGGRGIGGGYGRVRITCSGGDLSQTEIQYPVNSRHTPPCQKKISKTGTHSIRMPSFK